MTDHTCNVCGLINIIKAHAITYSDSADYFNRALKFGRVVGHLLLAAEQYRTTFPDLSDYINYMVRMAIEVMPDSISDTVAWATFGLPIDVIMTLAMQYHTYKNSTSSPTVDPSLYSLFQAPTRP
jgi:hypothetical protein